MLTYSLYAFWIITFLWALVSLLLQRREPSSTIIWIFVISVFPLIGSLFFFLFGPQRLERAAIKRKRNIEQTLAEAHPTPEGESSSDKRVLQKLPDDKKQVLSLVKQISEYEVSTGNRVDILSDPEVVLQSMQEAIQTAKRYVHLEYYIIESDEVTQQLIDSLAFAAERGVEVRILYDSLGSLFLKRSYFKKLLSLGAKAAGFLPITSIAQRFNINFRNHRKILLVDGKIAFTGSANLGKKYLGKVKENQWRENSVRVEGPVVLQLEDVFAKDWHFATKEDLFRADYYPSSIQGGDSVIQVLESGPDTQFDNLHKSLFMAISSAQEEILITTPYFIPDSAMITALTVAALRGIELTILVPRKCDSRFVQLASRSFYENMLRAGAKIYEYQPKIMHSKTMVIDNKWTVLGSFNMDIRSFRLNFELNLFIYGQSVAEQTKHIIQSDLKDSTLISLSEHSNRSTWTKLLENTCRLFSPVL